MTPAELGAVMALLGLIAGLAVGGVVLEVNLKGYRRLRERVADLENQVAAFPDQADAEWLSGVQAALEAQGFQVAWVSEDGLTATFSGDVAVVTAESQARTVVFGRRRQRRQQNAEPQQQRRRRFSLRLPRR